MAFFMDPGAMFLGCLGPSEQKFLVTLMDKGNVDVLIAPWNEEYFNECENFPQSKFKDMVDASSSAFTELESGATYSAPPKDSQLGKSSYWNK